MPGEPRFRSIGEMARETGLSISAIRFYERKGLVKPARSGVRRHYSAEDLLRLKIATRMRKAGFPVAHIACALGPSSDRRLEAWRDGIRRQIAGARAEIEQRRAMLEEISQLASCECADPALCPRV